MTTQSAPGIFEGLTSACKRLSHLEKEPIMLRSVAVLLALLIFPSFASAQELTMGQQGTHEVVKGETLWELAERYLGDPYRWPLIYEANRDRIEDPHWIYPHQLFVIPGLGTDQLAGQAVVQGVDVVTPGQEPAFIPAAVPRDLPTCPASSGRTVFYQGVDGERGCVMEYPAPENRTAFFVDPNAAVGSISGTADLDYYSVPRGLVYSAPWLEGWNQTVAFLGTTSGFAEVDASRSHTTQAMVNEKIQIELEEGVQLRVGDLLQSFVVGRAHEGLGQVIRPTGILVVTSVEEAGVVAMISAQFDAVEVGQMIRMVPAYDFIKGVGAQDVESNVLAALLGFDQDLVLQGFGAIAFLDVGEDQGIVAGDEFMAYVNQGDGWDGEEAARLQVILVNGAVASARVITLNEPILEPGLQLRLVRKMR